jgi:ATP phosphoribosyltransferase regulatory subunit
MPKQDRPLSPVGMATLLPQAAQRVRHLERLVMGCLDRWGYQEIIPPSFEYLDVLSAGLEPEVLEKCYKFVDRSTGRILLLRPDVTAQIAKIVAMGLTGPSLPLRLSYRTTVFRYEPEHAGREREIFQLGAELIGLDDAAADAEIVALAADSLKQLGLQAFKISVGHVAFFKALLAESGLSGEARKRAEHAAARKDLTGLEVILAEERIAKSRAAAILRAPGLYGGQEVLELGRAVAGRAPALRKILDRLQQVYRILTAGGLSSHVLLDLGEFRGFEYYDGIVFDVFVDGLGSELGGGGRYDHLIGQFGRPVPSTGFALDVDRLFRAVEQLGDGFPASRTQVLLLAFPGQHQTLFRVAQQLRAAGFPVVQETLTVGRPRVAEYARAQAKRSNVSAVVMLGLARRGADDAMVLIPGSRSLRPVKLKDLIACLTRGSHS